METSVNKAALKKLFEEIPLYYLMTSQPIIDAYIEHIEESIVPYECEDEEKEKAQRVENFKAIMSNRGKAILKDLFSDKYMHEKPFANNEIADFAMKFSESCKVMDWMYWMQEMVGYTLFITMIYVFWDKEEQTESKAETKEATETSTFPKEGFATWKEALEWAAQCFKEAKNGSPQDKPLSTSSGRKSISLSAALKELKSEENWTPAVAKAFAKVGISDSKELTPAKFLSLLSKNKKKDKETGKYVIGIWGERKVKDHEGFYVRKPDGTYKTEPVLRKVGSWTRNNLLLVLEQNGIYVADQ